MPLFDLDFDRLIAQLLPHRLRKVKMLAFIGVCFTGLKAIYSNFKRARINNIYKVKHGQSVAHVTAVLNDTFDPVQRRIYIYEPYDPFEPVWLWQPGEEQYNILYQPGEPGSNVVLWQEEELDNGTMDFMVVVPDDPAFVFDEARLNATVEEYKLPGMRWGWEI